MDATPLTVRVPPPLLDALDAFIAGQQPFHDKELTRPEAIRQLIEKALKE